MTMDIRLSPLFLKALLLLLQTADKNGEHFDAHTSKRKKKRTKSIDAKACEWCF